MRVTVRDNAGNVSRGQPDAPLRHQREGRPPLRRVRGGRVRIPFGRSATLRGRLSLSTGGSLAGQTVVATVDGPQEGAPGPWRPAAGHRSSRPLHDQGPGRAEPGLPPGVRRRPRGARDRPRGLGPRAGVEHDQGVAHAAVRRPRSLLRPPAGSRRARPPRSRRRPPGPRGRQVAHVRGRAHAHEGPLARLLPLQRRPGSYPIRLRIRRQAGFPFELGYSRTADDPGGLRGRILRARGLSHPMALSRSCVRACLLLLCVHPASRPATYDVYSARFPTVPQCSEAGCGFDQGGRGASVYELLLSRLLSPPVRSRRDLTAGARRSTRPGSSRHRRTRRSQPHAVSDGHTAGNGAWAHDFWVSYGLRGPLDRR